MLPRSSSGFGNSGWGTEDPGVWPPDGALRPGWNCSPWGTGVGGALETTPHPRHPQLPCCEESDWGECSEIFSLNASLPFLFSEYPQELLVRTDLSCL